jgi:hypothetical protein
MVPVSIPSHSLSAPEAEDPPSGPFRFGLVMSREGEAGRYFNFRASRISLEYRLKTYTKRPYGSG